MTNFLSSKFIYSISEQKQFDTFKYNQPQIAFIGRSNVGKSSLINQITNNKKLALVSKSPGKTKAINYFMTIDNKYIITDLPGYGYAKRSKAERNHWSELINIYIKKQKQYIRSIFILIDSRHEIKDIDIQAIEYIKSNNIQCVLVLTKADKTKDSEIEKRHQEIETKLINLKYIYPTLISVSSVSKMGIKDLIDNIVSVLI